MCITFLLIRLILLTGFMVAEIASLRGYSRLISSVKRSCFHLRNPSITPANRANVASSPLTEIIVTTTVEIRQAEKKYFSKFYEDNVSYGSSMSLDVFLINEKIELMLNEKLLTTDEVSDVWIDLWGCNCKCLTEEEAFETINAIYDLKKVYAG